jgi:hypothetical protein
LGEVDVLKKSVSFSLVVAAISVAAIAPAQAGKVYGNYGQGSGQYGSGQQDSGHYQGSNSSCNDVDIAVGTGLGGLVGGLIGNQFGKGSGNTAATIGGVILGGIAGNAIAKDACQDKRQDDGHGDARPGGGTRHEGLVDAARAGVQGGGLYAAAAVESGAAAWRVWCTCGRWEECAANWAAACAGGDGAEHVSSPRKRGSSVVAFSDVGTAKDTGSPPARGRLTRAGDDMADVSSPRKRGSSVVASTDAQCG